MPNYSFTFKPFGESSDGSCIEDFDDSEMDEILDLFVRLGEKCQETFNNLEKVSVEQDGNVKKHLIINYTLSEKGNHLSEDDFLFYIESLTGHNSDNILTFDGDDYVIMGNPDIKTPKNQDFLSKMARVEKESKLKR